MSEIRYNPFDPTVRENPHPTYARLRAEAPLFRVDPLGLSAVSRYADVLTILRDPETFSSRAIRDLFASGTAVIGDDAELTGETLIGTDPPVHTRLRKIVNRAFTPSRIAALESRIRQVTDELIEGFEARGECELISELASPLPVTIIAEILGVSAERRVDFKRWSDDFLLLATGRPTTEQQVSIRKTDEELGSWIDEVVEARRSRPADDLISALVAAESSEEVMTREEVGNLIVILLIAGNETTTNLIASSMLALLDHPAELSILRDHPELLPGAVEELLRYTSPVQLTLRRAMCDVELPAGKVAAGEVVALLLASANRDEERFPEPDRLDIRRDARGHVAFGLGTHFCIGANLARLETRIALEALIRRLREPERVGGPIEYTPSLLIRGPRRVQLRFAR